MLVRHLSSTSGSPLLWSPKSKVYSPLRRLLHQRPIFNRKSHFELTEPPNPSWKPGDGAQFVRDVGGARRLWDLSSIPSRDAYRLLASAIVPRPIALVSSLSEDGDPNLAPFSYFSMVAHNPPMISLSFSLPSRRPKDTRENILLTKEFVVNIVSEDIVEATNATSVEAPANVNEWILSGLTMAPSASVKPPFVQESLVNLECELYSSQDIPHPETKEITTTVILGRVKHMHVVDTVLSDDGVTVDVSKLRPVSRLGGTEYARLVEGFSLPRMSWKALKEQYESLLPK